MTKPTSSQTKPAKVVATPSSTAEPIAWRRLLSSATRASTSARRAFRNATTSVFCADLMSSSSASTALRVSSSCLTRSSMVSTPPLVTLTLGGSPSMSQCKPASACSVYCRATNGNVATQSRSRATRLFPAWLLKALSSSFRTTSRPSTSSANPDKRMLRSVHPKLKATSSAAGTEASTARTLHWPMSHAGISRQLDQMSFNVDSSLLPQCSLGETLLARQPRTLP